MLVITVTLLLLGQVLSFPQDERSHVRGYLMQAFETALLNNSKNLYNLQSTFFDVYNGESPTRVKTNISISVDKILNPLPDPALNCKEVAFIRCEPFLNQTTTECWRRKSDRLPPVDVLEWNAVTNQLGALTQFIQNPDIWDTILDVDLLTALVLSYIPLLYGATDVFQEQYSDYTPQIFLELKIPVLETMPCNDDLIEALRHQLIWVSHYHTVILLCYFELVTQVHMGFL